MKALSFYIPTILLFTIFLAGCSGGSSTPPCTGASCPCSGSNCPPVTGSDFLFEANGSGISGFQVDAVAGTVTATLPNATGPVLPSGVVLTSNNFLYVGDYTNNQVYAYSVNTTTGALTAVANSPFPITGLSALQGTSGMSADPAGKFLYVTNQNSNAVAAFTINSTGQLTTVANSPFATSTTPVAAVVDPSGKFLYVSNTQDATGGISAYTIDSTTGELTTVPGSPFATVVNGGPVGLAVHPNGKFLYAALAGGNATSGNQIAAQNINASTGGLSPVVGSPFPAGNIPQSVTIDPAGKYLFSTNSQDGTVSTFTIDSTAGGLTPLGTPTATGPFPFNAVVNSTSGLLFVDCGMSTSISAFTISSTGALTSVAPLNGGGTSSGLPIVAHP
jgi:6-phosphogluconolactonase (cycloisomerase 2 family)